MTEARHGAPWRVREGAAGRAGRMVSVRFPRWAAMDDALRAASERSPRWLDQLEAEYVAKEGTQ